MCQDLWNLGYNENAGESLTESPAFSISLTEKLIRTHYGPSKRCIVCSYKLRMVTRTGLEPMLPP